MNALNIGGGSKRRVRGLDIGGTRSVPSGRLKSDDPSVIGADSGAEFAEVHVRKQLGGSVAALTSYMLGDGSIRSAGQGC